MMQPALNAAYWGMLERKLHNLHSLNVGNNIYLLDKTGAQKIIRASLSRFWSRQRVITGVWKKNTCYYT